MGCAQERVVPVGSKPQAPCSQGDPNTPGMGSWRETPFMLLFLRMETRSESHQETGGEVTQRAPSQGKQAQPSPREGFPSPWVNSCSQRICLSRECGHWACPAQRAIKATKSFICFLHFLVREDKATFHPCPPGFHSWVLLRAFANKFSRKGCEDEQMFRFPGLEGKLPRGNFKF